MNKTKVLLVKGDGDYSVIYFESAHSGVPVKNVIDNPGDFASEDEEWELKVLEFDSVDPAFVEFVKSEIQDYDASKHINFFMETDIVGE